MDKKKVGIAAAVIALIAAIVAAVFLLRKDKKKVG